MFNDGNGFCLKAYNDRLRLWRKHRESHLSVVIRLRHTGLIFWIRLRSFMKTSSACLWCMRMERWGDPGNGNSKDARIYCSSRLSLFGAFQAPIPANRILLVSKAPWYQEINSISTTRGGTPGEPWKRQESYSTCSVVIWTKGKQYIVLRTQCQFVTFKIRCNMLKKFPGQQDHLIRPPLNMGNLGTIPEFVKQSIKTSGDEENFGRMNRWFTCLH